MEWVRYKSFVKFLKLRIPNLNVRRRKIKDYGKTQFIKKRFLIIIDNRIDETASLMVLCHELAHVLSWQDEEHGSKFGAGYKNAWKLYLEWVNG